jgi:hypothetical protein
MGHNAATSAELNCHSKSKWKGADGVEASQPRAAADQVRAGPGSTRSCSSPQRGFRAVATWPATSRNSFSRASRWSGLSSAASSPGSCRNSWPRARTAVRGTRRLKISLTLESVLVPPAEVQPPHEHGDLSQRLSDAFGPHGQIFANFRCSAWLGSCRRSNLNSSDKLCQALCNSRPTMCMTVARTCSSISVMPPSGVRPFPSPPRSRSIKGVSDGEIQLQQDGKSRGHELEGGQVSDLGDTLEEFPIRSNALLKPA